ncbi:MAG: alpha/beta fold hydrolase [Betaproteobacteria bacterium]
MKPCLLLLAGMLNDARVWQPVAQRLGSQADVRIAYFCQQETMPEMADHAWQTVADLPAHQALVLAGFSMGGYVLQQMLAAPRRTVQGVALVDSAIRAETESSRQNRLKTLKAIEQDFPALVQQAARWSTHPRRHEDPTFMQALHAMLSGVGAEAAARQTRAIAGREDHAQKLKSSQAPVLIVCGRQDKVTPPELSQEAADALPQAQLHWLEDTGHMTPLERPDELAALMRAWLDRIARFGNPGETA